MAGKVPVLDIPGVTARSEIRGSARNQIQSLPRNGRLSFMRASRPLSNLYLGDVLESEAGLEAT
jgi:hypothetical protein